MSGSYLKVSQFTGDNKKLNILNFQLPKSTLDIGGVTNAFLFKDGNFLDFYSSKTQLVGNPKILDGYPLLGDNAYFQTDTEEMLDFTYVVAFKIIKPLAFGGMLIGNIHATEGVIDSGWGITQNRCYYVNALGETAYIAPTTTADVGDWVIIAESRSVSGRFSNATRARGTTAFSQGTGHSTVKSNTQKVGVGSNTTASSRLITDHSTIAFAAVHSVTKNQTELRDYVDALASQLHAIDNNLVF